METIGKIRRRHKVRGESISAIARDLNLSRNTVKKYLKAEIDPVYRRSRQPAPKLGVFQSELEIWLEQDGQRPKKQRRSARRLFEDLQREGYTGAYDSIQRFVKEWKAQRPGVGQDAFVPLVFAPGEACQFDWSHEHVILSGNGPGDKSCPLSPRSQPPTLPSRLSPRIAGNGIRRPQPRLHFLQWRACPDDLR
jgi:transcriptional regulator with XRE-family HTH domain